MKRIQWLILVSVLTFLCAGCRNGESIEEIQLRAGSTAVEYYRLLIDGKYEDFVNGMFGGDSLPSVYKEQMVANAAMFVQQQKDEHKGINNVTLSSCTADTARHTADAFLYIHFADSLKEVVNVPLVEKGGVWYMK
ncbi:MAG: hypothetical protein NC344_11420 [Bacteroidales bacterium]|nr:hypothetical protein [Bacteroidales bacterium]MCM1148415.1 hypothetical protein [Bacteroidales bacterium]MCM1205051.1 hypothetical protein [Bacillota bacterium]MCM1511408.1 hypothetical protein [Clostridium sp.]